MILRLRFDDFTRATRSLTIAQATAESRALLARRARAAGGGDADDLARAGCTLVGLSLTNLEDVDAVQLALPVDRVRTLALDAAVDEVRDEVRLGGDHARRAAWGATPGSRCRCLPND